MKNMDKYLELRDELWSSFEKLVRTGAKFPTLVDVTYLRGINPEGLDINTEGDSWFLAKELIANPNYGLHLGEDLIIGTSEVTFIDTEEVKRTLEPDILDLYWLCEILDKA